MDNLRHSMAAYLHQDWWDEYDGLWESAVDDFVCREPDRAAGATAEVESLLDSTDSDEALSRALDDLGNFRDMGPAPDAARTWLQLVIQRLARPR